MYAISVQAGSVSLERATQPNLRAASLVAEAHSWGLDVAAWRAHLNQLTWPEVLRQLALAAGWGPRRCRPAKATRGHDDFGVGEDVIEGDDGKLSFRWPSRFSPGAQHGEYTMKEAAWKVRPLAPATGSAVMLPAQLIAIRAKVTTSVSCLPCIRCLLCIGASSACSAVSVRFWRAHT